MSSIILTQYTDPNCTWSWGAEPIVRRVEALYGDQLRIEFVLGGLIEDFEEFYDSRNDIREPADVAPHWEEASRKHGMPVDVDVWDEDPPRSTYPASVATKAAGFQGAHLELRYLRRLREVAATERRNIAKLSTLISVARTVGLDIERFVADAESDEAKSAFRRDMRQMRDRGVRAFPTHELEVDGNRRILGGFLPFEALESRLRRMAPGLEPRPLPPLRAFVTTYGYVATQEVAEVYRLDRGRARQRLEELAEAGVLNAVTRGNGTFWKPVDGRAPNRLGTGELTLGDAFKWRNTTGKRVELGGASAA